MLKRKVIKCLSQWEQVKQQTGTEPLLERNTLLSSLAPVDVAVW